MNSKVEEMVKTCSSCQSFTDKKTSEPIKAHSVPSKNWEKVTADLFGPLPSSHHVVVVQDLASRYPAAKLVTSTKASKVLPILADIYNAYGNPETQLSDNGPPFNSKEMDSFAEYRNIKLQKIPPLHPSANPVENMENFMRPLGKTMKIVHYNKIPEQAALATFPSNYRDPHPATGITPSAMLFRDPPQSIIPRQTVTEEDIKLAKSLDAKTKQNREENINASKYRIPSEFEVGDTVLLRNYKKTSKFQPLFLPEPCTILNTADNGRFLLMEWKSDEKTFWRHPDDVKSFRQN